MGNRCVQWVVISMPFKEKGIGYGVSFRNGDADVEDDDAGLDLGGCLDGIARIAEN